MVQVDIIIDAHDFTIQHMILNLKQVGNKTVCFKLTIIYKTDWTYSLIIKLTVEDYYACDH